jgi:uncharacterized protein (UPF0332 family)
MNKDRILEAVNNMDSYFANGLIKKQDFDKRVYDTYIKNSKESIKVAQNLFDGNMSDLWVIVTSYYTMFYIANAYLLKIGYKIGHKIAHKVTADALIVYVKDDIKESYISEYELASDEALSISENLIESFDFERVKRSRIQYETTSEIKHSKAQTSLNRAKEFVLEIEKLM